jgi:hypothetical protein
VLVRISDRFWFQNVDNGLFTPEEITEIEGTTLATIIKRNTNILSMQCFAMASPTGCGIAEETEDENYGQPHSLSLSLFFCSLFFLTFLQILL